jgi:chemotaxis response regulator CheB
MTKKPLRSPKSKTSKKSGDSVDAGPQKSVASDESDFAESMDPQEPARRPARPFLVVGVGASAGGMEAFNTLLQRLSADIPAAFVFVSHLDPTVESSLDEIFRRHTRLRVQMVREPTNIEPGTFMSCPPIARFAFPAACCAPNHAARTMAPIGQSTCSFTA